jgi:hypothetical protein
MELSDLKIVREVLKIRTHQTRINHAPEAHQSRIRMSFLLGADILRRSLRDGVFFKNIGTE